MKAGAHITNQVKLHRSFAEHYRREARIHRRKAEEMEKLASESDAMRPDGLLARTSQTSHHRSRNDRTQRL